MTNEEIYDEDEFIINLTIDGTEFEEVEVKVTDPNKTIRDQITSIVSVFELPKIDNGGNPIQYLLGQIMEEGEEPEILEFEDEDGREQALVDYNIQPGDHLHLISVPIAGKTLNITMNDTINNHNQKELSGRDARLWKERKELDTLCAKRKAAGPNPRQPSLSYIVRRKNVMGLPTEYEIWYRCKSIVGVKGDTVPREPIFGYLHKMSIVLPNNYPSADGNPIFTFRTDIWHPNIRYSGSFKGHVCLTIKEMGVLASLKDLVLRVERYLKYQMYHAQNTYPYPEDQNVAEWVREEGEPNNWVKFAQELPEPNSPAKKVEAESPTPVKQKPIIKSRTI